MEHGNAIIDLTTGAILDADRDALRILGVPDVKIPATRPDVIDQSFRPHVWGTVARALQKSDTFRCVRGVRWHHEQPWSWVSQVFTRISPTMAALRVEPTAAPPPLAEAGLTLTCPTTGSRIPRHVTGKLTQSDLDLRCAAEIVGEPCFASCGVIRENRWLHAGRDPSDC